MKKVLLFLLMLLGYACVGMADAYVGVGQNITINCKYKAERATFEHVVTSNMDYLSISHTQGTTYCTVYGIKEKKNIPILVRYYWTEYLYGHPVTQTDSYTEYVTVEKSPKPTSIAISPNPLYIDHIGGELTDISVVATPSSAYSTYSWSVRQLEGDPKAAHLLWTDGQTNKVRADKAGTTYITVTSAEGLTAEGTIIIRSKAGHYWGTDGNISWDLSEDGLLKLSGKGAMKDYGGNASSRSPWGTHGDLVSKIEIAEGITSIGTCAFYGCTNLTSVEIPSSVTSIGSSAFSDCKALMSVVLPQGITDISGAFSGCESLTEINLPDKITKIGNSTFKGCKSLKSINIPQAVTSIENYAFDGCKSLTSIILPEGVMSIGRNAFYNCSNISSLNIPDGVTNIDSYAFCRCSSLSYLVIPKGIKTISAYAFFGCSKLTSIIIPESITKFEISAFQACYSLTSIKIPDGVKEIDTSAFESCTSLTSIIIPNSVTDIHNSVFAGCKNLTRIISAAPKPLYLKYNPFDSNIYENATLYVPKGSKALYEKADRWTKFKNIVDGIPTDQNVLVNKITVKPTSGTLKVNETMQLTATVEPSDAADKSVTWSSDNTTVASVSTTGLVTAKSVGTATITCKANDGSGISASCSVKVESATVEPTSISLPSSKTIKVGESFTMSYTLNPSNATTTLTWTSDDSKIASVSSSGVVTGVKAGSTYINVRTANGKTAYCKVTVESATVEPTSISLPSSNLNYSY